MVEFHGHHRAWWTGSASASKLRPRMMCSGDHVGVSLIGRASQQEVRLFLGTTITRCLLSAVSPRSHGPLGNLALVREAVRPALDAEPGWTSCPQAISCTICPAAGVILQIPRETFPPPPSLSLSLLWLPPAGPAIGAAAFSRSSRPSHHPGQTRRLNPGTAIRVLSERAFSSRAHVADATWTALTCPMYCWTCDVDRGTHETDRAFSCELPMDIQRTWAVFNGLRRTGWSRPVPGE